MSISDDLSTPGSSRTHYAFMNTTRNSKRIAIGSCGVVALIGAAYMARESLDTTSPDVAEPVSARPVLGVAPSQPQTPPGAPAPEKPLVAPPIEAPQARSDPQEQPLREAVDSGRAQPVFFSLMGSRDVRIGQPFKIDIAVETENDFAAVALTIQYDPQRLRLLAVQPGSFMSQSGGDATIPHSVDRNAGLLRVDASEQPGGRPLSGGGTLAILAFVPTRSGDAFVSIARSTVRDSNNEGVPSATSRPRLDLTVRD